MQNYFEAAIITILLNNFEKLKEWFFNLDCQR